MVAWVACRSAGWLVVWVAGVVADWDGWLLVWYIGRLVDGLRGVLIDWSSAWLVDSLVGRLNA